MIEIKTAHLVAFVMDMVMGMAVMMTKIALLAPASRQTPEGVLEGCAPISWG